MLAAGTAAAGRMSKTVESDQRYYAVTSAARVLKEHLKEEKTNSIVYNFSDDNKNGAIDEGEVGDPKSFDNRAIPPAPYKIFDYASAVVGEIVPNKEVDLTFSVKGNTTLVSVKETIDIREPKLYLDISNYVENPAENTEKGIYTLRLTFTAEVDDFISKKTVSGEDISMEVTKNISWSYQDVEAGVIMNGGGEP